VTRPIRDGSFDVVVVAGPRLQSWPSPGARAISVFCAEMGLSVGVFGGESMRVRGVIPRINTGGTCWVEDSQARLHRIQARAVVKIRPLQEYADPFPGWRSAGVLPLSTATRLLDHAESVVWDPGVCILGSGNSAFRFGSRLLEQVSDRLKVFVIEPGNTWGGKPYAAWEVEKRRFEMLGGRFVVGKPASFKDRGAARWELRLEDPEGIRLLDVSRLVMAGPFDGASGLREYPSGSMLYELEQTSARTRSEDIEGWALEEDRARWLAAKISRALISDLGAKRDVVEQVLKRGRGRLRGFTEHREKSFLPRFEGKWTAGQDQARIRTFTGLPKEAQKHRTVASVECFEDIACNLCEKACPESAIHFPFKDRFAAEKPILSEADCTACGVCLTACPSGSIAMLQEKDSTSQAQVTLAWRGKQPWSVGDLAGVVNRRGDLLGTGRVTAVPPAEAGVQLVQVTVPIHLAWEARGLQRARKPGVEDSVVGAAAAREEQLGSRIEILLDGEKRWVSPQGTVLDAFRRIGLFRPGDALACVDGSCGLCSIQVDGSRKRACQTPVRKGMAILSTPLNVRPETDGPELVLCPCEGTTVEQVRQAIRKGSLRSPEAVVHATGVGGGRCHGQICLGAVRRLMQAEGVPAEEWIDWRFPFADWPIGSTEHQPSGITE
jgi:formate hydrogenlyase subunit 6/NADH:ubiquinone oxidoreductase subunit I